MPDLQQFISESYRRGLARRNRFYMSITSSPGGQLVGLFCESVDLPGVSFESSRNLIFGESRDVPYNRIFQSVSVACHVDADFMVKSYFDEWVNQVINPETRSLNYYFKYVRDVNIQLIDENINKPGDPEFSPYTMILHEAWPKSIQTIQLGQQGSDPFMKLNLILNFKYYTITKNSRPAPTTLRQPGGNEPISGDTDQVVVSPSTALR